MARDRDGEVDFSDFLREIEDELRSEGDGAGASIASGGAGDAESEVEFRELADALVHAVSQRDRRRAQWGQQADDTLSGLVVDETYRVMRVQRRTFFGSLLEVEHIERRESFVMEALDEAYAFEPADLERFFEEARATALLGEESITPLFDYGYCARLGGYLIVPPAGDEELEGWLADRGPATLEEMLELARALGGALESVHRLQICHGSLSPRCVTRLEGEAGVGWRVRDFGLADLVQRTAARQTPPQMPPEVRGRLLETPFIAPEVEVGRPFDPACDQYALASVLWMTLTAEPPPCGPMPLGIPAAVTETLERARSTDPADRWPSIERFVRELQAAAEITFLPSLDAMSFHEEHISGVEVPELEPRGLGFTNSVATPSIAFEVSEVSEASTDQPATVSVHFREPARLRREFRQNLSVGGLFVASSQAPPVDTPVWLELTFGWTERTVEVEARVVSHVGRGSQSVDGFGVALDASSQERVRESLREQGLGLDSSDRIETLREPTPEDALSPEAAYMLSRLADDTTVADARSLCATLPFQLEDVLGTLVEAGLVAVRTEPSDAAPADEERDEATPARRAEPPRASRAERPQPESSTPSGRQVEAGPRIPAEQRDDESPRAEIERLRRRARYFETRRNFVAAKQLLEQNAPRLESEAWFHHQLARLEMSVSHDLESAFSSIERARELDPDDPEIRQTHDAITSRLYERRALRPLYVRDVHGRTQLVRHDPGAHTVWFTVRHDSPRALSLRALDYRSGILQHSERAESPGRAALAVPTAPRFAAAAIETLAPPTIVTSLATSCAASADGRYLAEERRDGGASGLYVSKTAEEGAPIRVGDIGDEIGDLQFSPDALEVAWTVRDGARWSLLVSTVVGPARERLELEGPAWIGWSESGDDILVLDRASRRLLRLRADSRAAGRTIAEFDLASLERLCLDAEHRTMALVGRLPDHSPATVWLDAHDGRELGSFRLPAPFETCSLRGDGLLVGSSAEKLYALDFRAGRIASSPDLSLDLPSLELCRWRRREPLIAMREEDGRLTVAALDVHALFDV